MNVYSEKLKLKKANCILAIIENAEMRIRVCNEHIKFRNVFTTEFEMQKQIEIHQKAIARLENYYKNLISKPI